jgi:crotonobetainyl-CoA:carnitine CoA-transferase CaiB-like acyl-CoA transferase
VPAVSSPARPMDGMTVLDLTSNVAGPLACQVFTDLGARVIKIESADGEAARRIVVTRDGSQHLQPYFAPHNRGKLSVQLDLRSPAGLADALRLVDEADVFVVAFRPGAAARLGLGVADVQARNPRCVYASLSAYGPDDGRPGVDMLVQAESGLGTNITAPDGRPGLVASQIVDVTSGHALSAAVLAALLLRERTGVADHVSVAMYDVAANMQANHLTTRLNASNVPAAQGNAGVAVTPSGVFRTGDGWLVLAAYVSRHWQLLTVAIGRPELAADERFADQLQRSRHREELTAELEAAFAGESAEHWETVLRGAGVMAARVRTWSDVVASDLFAQRGLTAVAETGGQQVRTVRTPATYASFSPPADPHLPGLGEHNEALLG